MCLFIYLRIPRKTKLEKVRTIFDKHNVNLTDRGEVVGDKDIMFRATTSHCDCATSLGYYKRPRRKPRKLTEEEKGEVARWTTFLTELLNSGEVFRVGLLLQWADNAVEGKESLDVEELTDDTLLGLKENTQYEFLKKPTYA